ncbi:MAG: NlpC/P60 family protein [Mycobacteriales bacterium]
MRPVGCSGPRRRAAGLVLACLALAATTTFHASSSRVPLDGAPDQAAADVLHVARNQLGDPYQWGGNGPDRWDCSGLTSLWRTVGGAKDMPRVSRDQQAWAVPVPPEQLLRGDLVFFGHPVTHVGIVSGGGYMIDAGESRGAVVQRLIWNTGVVRYGRVPRPGMPKVRPWTPPPLPAPASSAPVADSPEAAAAAPRPAAPRPAAPQPAAAPKPAGGGLTPLQGLPGVQRSPSSPVALRAAANAKAVGVAGRPAGPTGWNDVSLVATAWKHAGGRPLPHDRQALVQRSTPVALAEARIGDVVVYNQPATHLGVYLGWGYMADASQTHGRVVVRRVYATPSVRLVRLG